MDSTVRDNSEEALKVYYPWTSMEENGRQPMQAFLIKEDRKFLPSYGLSLTTLCFTLICASNCAFCWLNLLSVSIKQRPSLIKLQKLKTGISNMYNLS